MEKSEVVKLIFEPIDWGCTPTLRVAPLKHVSLK